MKQSSALNGTISKPNDSLHFDITSYHTSEI